MQIDVVLPLACRSHGQDELARAQILLESLERNAKPGFLRRVWIVSEANQKLPVAARLVGRYEPELHFLDERELIGEPSQIRGWHKQQLVKLAAHQLTTPYYLAVDADCICHSPIGADQLIPGGRGVVSPISKSVHPHWWEQTSRTLKIPLNTEEPIIGVTPQVLSQEISKQVKLHIETYLHDDWLDFLGGTGQWTEYTAYDLIARQYRLFDRHHIFGELSGNNLWRNGDKDKWRLSRHAPGFFSVVQSNTGISAQQVRVQCGALNLLDTHHRLKTR